jgi:hypothetical protein
MSSGQELTLFAYLTNNISGETRGMYYHELL